MKNRAGEYSTNLTGELQYKSFLPNSLPPSPPIEPDEDTINLLSKANRSIGILEGMSRQIPNIELFVSMYVRKEALLSSQIEGTQATFDDILDPNIEENTNQNVVDVINYIKASQYASALYISYFFKRNRIEYYDRLTEVRAKGNFEQWIKFFLLAAYESAQDAINTIERLIELHDRNFKAVKHTGKASKTVIKVFNYLEGSPIIDIKKPVRP